MKGRRGLGISLRAAVALALTLVGALLVTSQGSAQENDLSLGRITLRTGAQGEVRLEASNVTFPGLGAWTIDIDYNTNVVTPTICIPHNGGVCNPDFQPGQIRVVGASARGLQGDFTLATFEFRCIDEGGTFLSINVREFSDATPGNPQPIDATVVNGGINCLLQGPPVLGAVLGDVNCDSLVNSIDASLILQREAGLGPPLPCPENGDVNRDGRIDARDATIILQIDAGLI